MRVTSLDDAMGRPRRVAVGTFDGVHRGHQAVIDGNDTVLTFEPHPLVVLRPEAAPSLLTPFEIKRDAIAELGVEELVVVPFDLDFSRRGAADFIDDVIVDRLGAAAVSVGENFRFGHRAEGDGSLLRADGRFDTRIVPLVEVEGEQISSSLIRRLVEEGDLRRAASLLGRPFTFEGVVAPGDRRGHSLGMPTANIVPDERYVLPARGVYAGRAGGHAAAINVGVRPTFDSDRGVLIETHLLDFSGDLYGRALRIEFLERIRDEARFDSVEALVEQMHRDVEAAREIARSRP